MYCEINKLKKQWLAVVLIIFSVITLTSFYYFEDVINPTMIVLVSIVTILSFKVSRCYNGTPRFMISYLLLGFMFGSYALGEIYYFAQGVWGVQEFPSFEDIFYGLYYMFGIGYVLQQVRFYEIKSTLQARLVSGGLGALMFAVYLASVWDNIVQLVSIWEISDMLVEFAVASVSMGLACMFFSITILATINLRYSERFREWVFVLIAVTFYTLADLHYYVTENLGYFTYSDISNYGWFVLPVIFIYILLRLSKNPIKSV